MDARSKPLKIRRKRASARQRTSTAPTTRGQDQALLRQLAAELRRNDDNAERLRAVLQVALRQRRGPTVAEVMDAAPDISGPEFDHVFEEIERFRHSPIAMKVRDIDL